GREGRRVPPRAHGRARVHGVLVMDTLALDLEEVASAPPRVKDWVRDRRRRSGATRDEPVTWFAYLETDHPDSTDRELVTLGRSPADVLTSATLYARARSGVR